MDDFIRWDEIEATDVYKNSTDDEKKRIRANWEKKYAVQLLPTVEEFRQYSPIPVTWREIVASDAYQKMTPEEKDRVKENYAKKIGYDPEQQMFRSDGNIFEELIKGITESSSTAELFKPEAETVPVGTVNEVARNIGSVIGDIPMFAAGSFIGGITGNPEVATITSFSTPTLIKNIYRAKNVGALSKLPEIKTAQLGDVDIKKVQPLWIQSPGGDFVSQEQPYITYVEKDDPNAQKFMDIVKQTAKETAISAATGAALGAVGKFIKGPTGNAIVDKVIEKSGTVTKPQELETLQGIVKNIGDINANSKFLQRYSKNIINAIESGNYIAALENAQIMKGMAKKVKVLEDIVIPSTVLTGVPSALHGEMPTTADVASAVTLTAAMPLAMKKPAELMKKLVGFKQFSLAKETYDMLEQYKQAAAKKNAEWQYVKSGNRINETVKLYDILAHAGRKEVKYFTQKYIKDELYNHDKLIENYKKEYKAKALELLKEAQEKNENYKYKMRDIIPKSKYEELKPEAKPYYIPMTDAMEYIKKEIDTQQRARRIKLKQMYKDNGEIAPEVKEAVGDALRMYIHHDGPVTVMRAKDRSFKLLKNYLEENDLIDKPKNEIISHFENLKKKPGFAYNWSDDLLRKKLEALIYTRKYITRNVAKAGAEAFKELHTNTKNIVNGDRLKKNAIVYYATRGAKYITNYQMVYTDVKTLHKYEPNSVVRMAKVSPRDLYHTGLDGVMVFKTSEATLERFRKTGKPWFIEVPFQKDALIKMQEHVDFLEKNGLKTDKQSKLFFGNENAGILEVNFRNAAEIGEGREPRIIKAFSNETVDLTKNGSSPETVAPITMQYIHNMVHSLKKYNVTSEFLLHAKMKQGVYFWEELGDWGRANREALIEAETNGIRLAKQWQAKTSIFKDLNKDQRELITYCITGQNPLMAELYMKLDYRNPHDPHYEHLQNGTLLDLLAKDGKAYIAAQETIKFYREALEHVNRARASVGRDPIMPSGPEGSYSPLAMKQMPALAMMLLNHAANGGDIIGKSAKEITQHFEEQVRKEPKPTNVTFHNLKPKLFNVPVPEMDAAKLLHRYANDAARYVSLQPITVYIADAISINSINGMAVDLEALSPGASKAIARMQSDLGFLQMGHPFAEKFQQTEENRKLRKAAMWFQNNVAGATILYNTNVMVNQIGAIRNTLTHFGPGALFEIGINLAKLANYKEVKRIMKESDVLYGRFNEPFRELYEGVGKLRKITQDVGIFPSKVIDGAIAMATYKMAKDRYIRENPYDIENAVRYANEVVAKTQAGTLMTDRAPIQRGIFGIYITTFCNAPLADYGYFVHNVMGYHRDVSKGQVALALTNYLLATAIINTVYEEVLGMESMYPAPISRYIDLKSKHHDDKFIYYSMVTELMKMYPLGQGSRMGGSVLGPAVTVMDNIMAGTADPRFINKALYGAITTIIAPAVTGVPTYGASQARRMIRAYKEEGDLLDYLVVTKKMTTGR